MAGVFNKTARQFNLKTIGKNGHRVVVRVVPGFNVVDDAHWEHFVSKDGKTVDAYVAELKKKGQLDFGATEDEKELESEAPKSKSKSTAPPKPAKK